MIFRGSSYFVASSSRTSTDVEILPVFVLRPTSKLSFSKISPSCAGELMLNCSPASSYIAPVSPQARLPSRVRPSQALRDRSERQFVPYRTVFLQAATLSRDRHGQAPPP